MKISDEFTFYNKYSYKWLNENQETNKFNIAVLNIFSTWVYRNNFTQLTYIQKKPLNLK